MNEKKCAKCGACTAVCPVYKASGNDIYSARGKRHLAEVFHGEQPGPIFEDIYSKCLLCGACSTVCPRDLDIVEDVITARSTFSLFYGEHGYQKYLARKALNHPRLLGIARGAGKSVGELLFNRLPIQSGLRLRLAMLREDSDLCEESLPDEGAVDHIGFESENGLTCFPGCAGSYFYPEIVRSAEVLLSYYGHRVHVPDGLGCCGLATMAAGDVEGAKRLAKQNIIVLEKDDGPIIISCASCFSHLGHYSDLFKDDYNWQGRARAICDRVVEVSLFLRKDQPWNKLESIIDKGTLKVFYHDPCHLRHSVNITEEPRSILRKIKGVELLELEDGPQCCGQGGLFHVGAPEISTMIRDDLARKILVLEPDIITTTCSGCIMQLKSAVAAMEQSVPVVHLLTFIKGQCFADKG